MPSSDAILSGLTTLANEWRTLAIGWHVFFGILLLTPILAPRLSNRHVGYLLSMPLLSVSGLAWSGGNAFNATVFFALALLLLLAARRFSDDSIRCSFGPIAVSGAVLLAFGWSYPHFLQADHWTAYLYAAPLGIVPCPTLSALVGCTLVFGLYRSTVWASALTATSLFYGVIGVVRLRVELDSVLLVGASILVVLVVRECARPQAVRARQAERTCRLPGDEFIPDPLDSLTHAITIARSRHDVWPWLVQMGAGSRAGWYSYDFLDNGRQASASRIVPELQQIATGTLFPALPGVTEGFEVLACEREQSLILGWKTPTGAVVVTWAFVLDKGSGDSTRLIVRVRAGQAYRFHALPGWISRPLVRVVHFVMQRKQLLGIARRAESSYVAVG